MLNKTHTKYIQSLSLKKFRDSNNVFIAEGTKVVVELLQSNIFVCRQIFALKNWLLVNNQIIKSNTEIFEVEDFELKKISQLTTPSKVLAIFIKKKPKQDFSLNDKITLLLDGIQDPGNLGTIIRTADWFGIQNIICSPICADMYNIKVVQSTMGSLARVNIFYANLQNCLKQNKTIKKYATTLDGKNVKDLPQIKEALIIIGNEGNGISKEVIDLADEKITIAKFGKAESLNAAVATGIILATIH